MSGLLYLNCADVLRACRELDPVALIREALAAHASGACTLADESYLEWTADGEHVRSLNMPAFMQVPARVAGTKIINANPANVDHGLPRASGLTLLFDPES